MRAPEREGFPPRTLTIVNVAEHAEPGWRFLEGMAALGERPLRWQFFSAEPENWLERRVRRPKLSRWRATWQAVNAARRADHAVLISHLPRTTLWTAVFARAFRMEVPHLAFAFNFTTLPSGVRRKMMSWGFGRTNRFAVFVEPERRLYAQWFGIPPQRIDVLPWAMDTPSAHGPPSVEPRYVAALGGEGRDYRNLVEAARLLPHVRFVVVTRRYSLPEDAPTNVTVLVDRPVDECWNILRFAECSVVPLRDGETNCGHITLVASALLGKAVVATRSSGIAGYVDDGVTGILCAAGDSKAFAAALRSLWDDPARAQALGRAARDRALERNDPERWASYVGDWLAEAGVGGS